MRGNSVVAGFVVPAIHDLLAAATLNTWMPGTSPGMTIEHEAAFPLFVVAGFYGDSDATL
jgi:hypothetical protein